MPTPPIPHERAQRIKNTIEQCLRDGFNPWRQRHDGGKGSSVQEAHKRLKAQGYPETSQKINGFLRTQEKRALRGEDHYSPDWSLFAPAGVSPAQIRRGAVHRWLITSAQDDTDIHPRFWNNLQAYAKHIDAEILIGGFTYQTMRHTERMTLTNTYRKEIRDYMRFDPIELGPVMFHAEMNTLPTAARPLSGLLTYSQGRDAIFPHAKLAYQTAPAPKGSHVPSLMTTGAVTIPNYIQKKAGMKAEFHHILGATLVEVTDDGSAWHRPISAISDGSFQDLDIVVRNGNISHGNRIEAATLGDLHSPSVEEHVADWLWGTRADSLINALRPKYAFIHDLLSIEAHSRWVIGDAWHKAEMDAKGLSDMQYQIRLGAELLRQIEREHTQPVVIYSNHDDRLLQWAKRPPDRNDTRNIAYWHRCNLAFYEALAAEDETFDILLWALKQEDPRQLAGIGFVPLGGSFQICQETGGIENGYHGHDGPNGAKGSVASFTRMATRLTIGDKHSPEIQDGLYVAGITGNLEQGYNKGPGSWKRAHVLTYPNGKRTIITQNAEGRWRA